MSKILSAIEKIEKEYERQGLKIKGFCPWCEERSGIIDSVFEVGGPYFVSCLHCGCRGPEADTNVMARKLWNERAIESHDD